MGAAVGILLLIFAVPALDEARQWAADWIAAARLVRRERQRRRCQ